MIITRTALTGYMWGHIDGRVATQRLVLIGSSTQRYNILRRETYPTVADKWSLAIETMHFGDADFSIGYLSGDYASEDEAIEASKCIDVPWSIAAA